MIFYIFSFSHHRAVGRMDSFYYILRCGAEIRRWDAESAKMAAACKLYDFAAAAGANDRRAHHQPRAAAGNFIVFWPRARLIIIAARGARIRPIKGQQFPRDRHKRATHSESAAHTKLTFYAHSVVQSNYFLLNSKQWAQISVKHSLEHQYNKGHLVHLLNKSSKSIFGTFPQPFLNILAWFFCATPLWFVPKTDLVNAPSCLTLSARIHQVWNVDDACILNGDHVMCGLRRPTRRRRKRRGQIHFINGSPHIRGEHTNINIFDGTHLRGRCRFIILGILDLFQ